MDLTTPAGYSIEQVTPGEDVKRLRHLHTCLLPVEYPPAFYKRVETGEIRGYLARQVKSGECVGCVTWQVQQSRCKNCQAGRATLGSGKTSTQKTCHVCQKPLPTDLIAEITTLGVKILHRKRGLGTALVKTALKTISDSEDKIRRVKLCVQVGQEDLIRFYKEAGGFRGTGVKIPNYYRRLEPSEAVVLEAELK